jgi:hypothetical protein
MTATPVCLKFHEEVSPVVRARIDYAFRVFAAIYNYRVVDLSVDGAAISFEYGEKPSLTAPGRFHIPARYHLRPPETQVDRVTKHRYSSEELPLFYGIDALTGSPDWLGEIFEWLSSSDERSVVARDPVGRVPYSKMIFSRLGISPSKPYATLLMAWMENVLRNGNQVEKLLKAPSPLPDVEHIVVCSHDIDFYYVNRLSSLVRLLKNLGISIASRSWPFFAASLKLIFELFAGRRVGDYLTGLLEALEKSGFRSTLFVISRQGHRRDANYRVEDLVLALSKALKRGLSVDLHGSYTSLQSATLQQERFALAKALGCTPIGNRQHWLRFGEHKKLFEAIEAAGLVFDSSLGFSDMVGFRNGASFAFPPYDFTKEKPHQFLEIPLAIMDTNLAAISRRLGKSPQDVVDEVLQESRKWGWGGISLLWHNPIEPLNVSPEINRVFWTCVSKREQVAEQWMCGRQFLERSLGRYQDAGVLNNVTLRPS